MAAGFEVTRQQILLDRPIKILGLHPVRISLHPEVEVGISVNVARTQDEAERQARGEDVNATDDFDDEEETLSADEVFEDEDVARAAEEALSDDDEAGEEATQAEATSDDGEEAASQDVADSDEESDSDDPKDA